VNHETDVIINPINADIIFDKGIPFFIKKKGGESVEKEAFRFYPAKLGDVFTTKAGTLPAKFIIHLVNRQFGKKTSYSSLKDSVIQALKIALKLEGVKNISIPPIFNKFSPEITAKIIADGIREAIAQNEEIKNLNIQIIIYDEEAFNKFDKVLQDYLGADLTR
jgi:O-acetyl-ADP-ribose deacetylase (regulator of RNase III)